MNNKILPMLFAVMLIITGCSRSKNNGITDISESSVVSDSGMVFETTQGTPTFRIPYSGSFPTEIPAPFGYEDSVLTEAYCFISENEGLAVCIDGIAGGKWASALSHTTNRGQDWDRTKLYASIVFYPTGLFFYDGLNGIMIGYRDVYFYICETADGGNTWVPYFTQLSGASPLPIVKEFYGENSEILFPVNEFSSFEKLSEACKSYVIEKRDKNSAYVIFRYEKNGAEFERKVIYDKNGMHN